MNKFRANLHPAFLDTEKQEFYPTFQEKEQEIESVEEQAQKGKEEVTEDVVQKPEFSNIAGKLASEMSSRYTDMEQWKKDRKRFQERVKSKSDNGNGEEYANVWEKKIRDGFDNLIKALEENKYFDGLSEEEKTQKKAEILVKYSKEVRSQYEKYIWRAGDKTFEGVKDSIFGQNSEEYPANKIYKELTGAVTIYKGENARTKVTTYDIDPINKKEDGKDTENENVEENKQTKEKVRFIAHDLPNYLWQVKDKTTLQKIASWVPFVKYRVDKPSLEDKKQLETFVKASNELGGQNPELRLLEVFDNLGNDATEKQIREALGLDEDKSIKNIKKAFQFYKSTQYTELNAENQHALYLSILRIVKNQGGFNKTIDAFKKDVEEHKNRENKEGKEYKKGDNLDKNLKDFANSLGIRDYTSATRLSEKSDEYFEKTDIVDILADLNNDGVLTFSDSGLTKTGLQFKEIFNSVGEEIALKNLLDTARLDNKRLNSPLKDEEFTKEEIKKGNKKLILLLQNIISNPKADLNILMTYGADASERLADSKKLLEDAESKKDKAASELLKNIDLSKINMKDVEVASSEGLHQAVAGALYTEYSRGVGLGGRITFDEWVKGISLNGGFQVGDKGVDVGVTLAYNREINLGKGWSVTPGASIGFVPMFKFGQSLGVEAAKTWINDNNVQEKLGVRASFTNIAGGVQVYSAFVGYESNSLKGIEGNRGKIESLFKSKIVSPLLESIANEFKDKEFDLSIDENLNKVKELIWTQVGKLDEGGDDALLNSNKKVEDIQAMVDNTARYFLQNCNKAQIQDKTVREMIAGDMSYDYSYTRAELNKEKLDGKTEFSDARVGASWVQAGAIGALVIHAGIGFTKYDKDIYGDGAIKSHTIKMDEEFRDSQKWNAEMIEKFNQYMPEGSKFELVEIGEGEEKREYIKVPEQAIRDCDILINSGMKGAIKKDESGNVLLSTETVISMPTRLMGVARTSTEVLIGGGNKSDSVKLNSILNDESWFAQGDIDTSKLTGKEFISFDLDGLNSALDKLKKQLPEDKDLQEFSFDESILSQLEQGKKYVIILGKTSEGIKPRVQEVQEGSNLRIEYEGNEGLELMSKDARRIADKIYSESLKVTSNRLYAISHDIRNNQGVVIQRKWDRYSHFADAMKNQNYSEAKDILIDMLPDMDRYIGESVKFSSITDELNNIEEKDLGQALLSVNNIFARVTSVHGGKDGKYHFKRYRNGELVDRSMGDVISGRAKEISRKVTGSGLDESTKQAYQNLINFAENDRESNPDKYSEISQKGKVYEGAIGINLGNAINLENPLFNPEVYESPVIDSSELNFEGKDELQEHIMKDVIANNKSLLQPILSALNLDGNSISVIEGSYNKETGKITLDIDGKNVILGADMKFGYFAQCVNHMLLIDNITAEIPGEGAYVDFKSSVVENGEVKEVKLKQGYGKTTYGMDFSFIGYRKEETKQPEGKPDTTTDPEEKPREKQDTTTNPEETVKGTGENTGDGQQEDSTDNQQPEIGGPGDTGHQEGNGPAWTRG